jgi:hypothetical protein
MLLRANGPGSLSPGHRPGIASGGRRCGLKGHAIVPRLSEVERWWRVMLGYRAPLGLGMVSFVVGTQGGALG